MNPRIALGLAGFAALAGLAAAATSFDTHAFAQGAPAMGAAPGAPAMGAPGATPAAARGGGEGALSPDDPRAATVNDPPGLPPDPTHIIVTLPDQIKWKGNESLLYGNPTKPGDPYSVLVKLQPGQFSAPHKLPSDRWVFVVSGTLWVSDSAKFDPKSTYPVTGNNFITNLANNTFWEGSRAGATEPTVLVISGVGSANNHIMGEYSRKTTVSVNDAAGPAPDASHMTIKPIPTTGNPNLYGGGQGSTTEGTPYGVIQTWKAGSSSSPHYHAHPRYIYVLQGPWWVSSSTIHDLHLTYPVPTGSFVQDIPHGIHWDGNRLGADYTTRLYITGVSPATNHGVDIYGNDLPQRAGAGGRGGAAGGRGGAAAGGGAAGGGGGAE